MAPAPYTLTDKDVLYYLHIPKTAGTSFNDILKSYFSPQEASFGLLIQDFLKLSPEQIAKLKMLSGHYCYDIQPFIPHSLVYITMLRDPLERTISNYAHIRRSPNHFEYETVKSQSLLEFVKDPRTQYLYANVQTRYIAADPNILERAKNPNGDSPERRMESFVPEGGFSNPALLKTAQERLSKFAFVGLAEQFDEAVEVLCYTFGWPTPTAPKVLNVSANRPAHEDIPQEAIGIIHENTQLDAALYETGKQLFDARYQHMLQDHPEKIKHEANLISESLADMQRQLVFQKRLIDTLQQEKAVLENRIAAIAAIEMSFGWQFVLRFNAVRKKLIPEGSTWENIYQKLRDRLV